MESHLGHHETCSVNYDHPMLQSFTIYTIKCPLCEFKHWWRLLAIIAEEIDNRVSVLCIFFCNKHTCHNPLTSVDCSSKSRNFHSYVTVFGEGPQIFDHSKPLSSESSLACHTNFIDPGTLCILWGPVLLTPVVVR